MVDLQEYSELLVRIPQVGVICLMRGEVYSDTPIFVLPDT